MFTFSKSQSVAIFFFILNIYPGKITLLCLCHLILCSANLTPPTSGHIQMQLYVSILISLGYLLLNMSETLPSALCIYTWHSSLKPKTGKFSFFLNTLPYSSHHLDIKYFIFHMLNSFDPDLYMGI